MIPKPISSKAPSLGAQASRAVLWNVLFVPLRMIAEVTATLIKLSVMAQPSFGMISLISATNNGLVKTAPATTIPDPQTLLLFIDQWNWLLIAAILAVLFFGIFYDVLMAYL